MAIDRLNVGAFSGSAQIPFYDPDQGTDRRASLTDLAIALQDLSGVGGSFITQYASPNATGFTATVRPPSDGANVWLLLTPLGAYAAGTVILPPKDQLTHGQEVLVSSTQAITTLTVLGNGALVNGAPSTLAVNDGFRLRYDFINASWYLVASNSDGNAVAGTVDALRVPASEFGVTPDVVDCAPAFTDLAEYIMQASDGLSPVTGKVVIELPAGDFFVDGAKMDLTYRGAGSYTPRFTLRGAGKGVTVIRSAPTSTAAAVLEIGAGFAAEVVIEDLSIEPRGDIAQDALHIFATRRTLDGTGGITSCTMNRVGARSQKGDGLVFVGGDDFQGPNQFLKLEMCTVFADQGIALRTLGQFGQANIVNGEFSGGYTPGTSASPAIAFTQDLRATVAPTDADTANNFVTVALEVPSGTPVRIVGTNLPTGLSTGVTYYVRRYDIKGATGGDGRLSLHTTRANVANNTRVSLGTAGTLGNWYIAPLYVTSVTTGTMASDFPLHLIDATKVRLVGTGLPTGLATATDYYVIRKSARTWGLATTKANALAGVGIAFTGGTVTTFGLSGGGFGNNTPYSIRLDNVTAQNSLTALYLCGAADVKANLHIENCKNSVHCYQSQMTLDGGAYANPADDGGAGVLLYAVGYESRVTIMGAPITSGTTDKMINAQFAAVYGAGSFVTRNPSTTATTVSGVMQGISAAATVDVGACDAVLMLSTGVTVNNISSKLGPRSRLALVSLGGSVTYSSSGNLALPGASVTIADQGVAVFEQFDNYVKTWVLVSKT